MKSYDVKPNSNGLVPISLEDGLYALQKQQADSALRVAGIVSASCDNVMEILRNMPEGSQLHAISEIRMRLASLGHELEIHGELVKPPNIYGKAERHSQAAWPVST